MSVQARRSVDGAAIVDSRGPQVYQCCRPLLLISRSLFPDVQASFDSYLRYASISVGLFCAYNRSLFPYGRPLLTLTHTRTSGMLVLVGLFCLIIGLF